MVIIKSLQTIHLFAKMILEYDLECCSENNEKLNDDVLVLQNRQGWEYFSIITRTGYNQTQAINALWYIHVIKLKIRGRQYKIRTTDFT